MGLGSSRPVILARISFHQVMATEVSCTSEVDSEIYSKFNILAVSDEGGLYFVQSKRYYDKIIKFSASGIPVRAGVRMIAAQYNASVRTNEVLYVTNTSNEICHLAQDPIASLWSEATVAVKPLAGKTQFVRQKAFVTARTLTDGNDMPVPDG